MSTMLYEPEAPAEMPNPLPDAALHRAAGDATAMTAGHPSHKSEAEGCRNGAGMEGHTAEDRPSRAFRPLVYAAHTRITSRPASGEDRATEVMEEAALSPTRVTKAHTIPYEGTIVCPPSRPRTTKMNSTTPPRNGHAAVPQSALERPQSMMIQLQKPIKPVRPHHATADEAHAVAAGTGGAAAAPAGKSPKQSPVRSHPAASPVGKAGEADRAAVAAQNGEAASANKTSRRRVIGMRAPASPLGHKAEHAGAPIPSAAAKGQRTAKKITLAAEPKPKQKKKSSPTPSNEEGGADLPATKRHVARRSAAKKSENDETAKFAAAPSHKQEEAHELAAAEAPAVSGAPISNSPKGEEEEVAMHSADFDAAEAHRAHGSAEESIPVEAGEKEEEKEDAIAGPTERSAEL